MLNRGIRARNREEKRQRLLDTARALFAARGYAVPIADICREARVAVGTFYSHFDDKVELMAELLRSEHDRLVAIDRLSLERGADLEETITAFLDHSKTGFFRAMREAVETEPALRQGGGALLREARDRLAVAVQRARAAHPSERSRLGPETAAWAAIALAWHTLGALDTAREPVAMRLSCLLDVLVFG